MSYTIIANKPHAGRGIEIRMTQWAYNSTITISIYDERGSMLTQQDPRGALTSIRVKVTRSEPNRIDDCQGSTRLMTNASGVVTDNYAYRAFGTE